MAAVEISYKGNTIASMDDSGAKTLLTSGSYCEDNITVSYTASGGGGGSYTVDITLGRPASSSSFVSCLIYEWDGSYTPGQQIGEITSPTGSTTVTTSTGGIEIQLNGDYVSPPAFVGGYVWSSSMIGLAYTSDGNPGIMRFAVCSDGELFIDNIDWSD